MITPGKIIFEKTYHITVKDTKKQANHVPICFEKGIKALKFKN